MIFIHVAKQIGSVPTPWPSWMIAAHPTRAPSELVKPFLGTLTTYVSAFDSEEKRVKGNVEFIKEKFGYPEGDINVSDHDLIVSLRWGIFI